MLKLQLKKSLTCLLLAAAALTARPTFAEDKPDQFFRAALIVDRIKQLSETSGFTLPPIDMLTQQQEISHSFLGRGSVVSNRPVGIASFIVKTEKDATLDSILAQSSARILPVTAESATFAQLQSYGTTADADAVSNEKEKTVLGKNIALKRTTDYVAWSDGPAAIHVTDDLFTEDFKKPNVLGVVSLNLGVLRAKAPQVEEKLVEQITHFAPHEKSLATTIALVRQIVDSIDTVNLVATHADDALFYTTTVNPVGIKNENAFSRPAFIDPQFAEIHIVWPNAKIANWIPSAIENLDMKDAELAVDAETVTAVKKNSARAAKLILGDGAFSIGFYMEGKGLQMPIFHTVTQYAADVDVAKEVNAIADSVKAIAKKQKVSSPIDVSEYEFANQKVTRVTVLVNDAPAYYIDLAQSGRRLAATYSIEKQEGKAVKLLIAPSKPETTDFIFATLDVVTLMERTMGGFMPNNNGNLFTKMRAGIGDARYTVTAKSDKAGKAMIVEVKQPLVIGREMEKAFKDAMHEEMEMPEEMPQVDPVEPVEPVPPAGPMRPLEK